MTSTLNRAPRVNPRKTVEPLKTTSSRNFLNRVSVVSLTATPKKKHAISGAATGNRRERMAPATTRHGVLLDVFGVGVLILGKSGIGKSECALDLIIRGHRLVSDDVVKIIQTDPATLFGTSFNLIRNLMEIRGLGIVNIRDLFGVEAIRKRKKIDLVVELIDWLSIDKPERLGLDQNTKPVLGVDMPFIQIPVTPGRNLSTIIEVAARNHILRISGIRTPEELEKQARVDGASRIQGLSKVVLPLSLGGITVAGIFSFLL